MTEIKLADSVVGGYLDLIEIENHEALPDHQPNSEN